MISSLVPLWSKNKLYNFTSLNFLSFSIRIWLHWDMIHGHLKMMRVLLLLSFLKILSRYCCLNGAIKFFYSLADFLSLFSINCWKKGVEVSNYNWIYDFCFSFIYFCLKHSTDLLFVYVYIEYLYFCVHLWAYLFIILCCSFVLIVFLL